MSLVNGVDLRQPVDAATQVTEVRERAKAVVSSQSSEAAKADEATLSPAGSLIAQALDGSDVRTEKVDALRHAIANGTYNVPSAEVAGKLIDTMTS